MDPAELPVRRGPADNPLFGSFAIVVVGLFLLGGCTILNNIRNEGWNDDSREVEVLSSLDAKDFTVSDRASVITDATERESRVEVVIRRTNSESESTPLLSVLLPDGNICENRSSHSWPTEAEFPVELVCEYAVDFDNLKKIDHLQLIAH